MYSPTDSTEPPELLAEYTLPQISQIYTELLTEYILPRNPQHPKNCLLSVFPHRFHRFTQKLGCLQGGALVSSAPPEISRFCEFCVFCGRHFATAEAGDLRYYLPHPNNLCRSVKSVGEHPPAEGSVNSVQSVGGSFALKPSV